MTKSSGVRVVTAMVGLACVSMVGAQEVDMQDLARPKVSTASCNEIMWQKDLVTLYPRIADACQEVVISNGLKFARFTGKLVQVNRDGSVKIEFNDRQGHALGQPTLRPSPDQRVQIQGTRYRFSELQPGQELSLYLPENRFAMATEPNAAPESMAQIVAEEPGSPTAAAQDSARLAQAALEPATTPSSRLPHTASSLPLLALAGILALLSGFVLTARRLSAGGWRKNAGDIG